MVEKRHDIFPLYSEPFGLSISSPDDTAAPWTYCVLFHFSDDINSNILVSFANLYRLFVGYLSCSSGLDLVALHVDPESHVRKRLSELFRSVYRTPCG